MVRTVDTYRRRMRSMPQEHGCCVVYNRIEQIVHLHSAIQGLTTWFLYFFATGRSLACLLPTLPVRQELLLGCRGGLDVLPIPELRNGLYVRP